MHLHSHYVIMLKQGHHVPAAKLPVSSSIAMILGCENGGRWRGPLGRGKKKAMDYTEGMLCQDFNVSNPLYSCHKQLDTHKLST